jgi:hypothetical protein
MSRAIGAIWSVLLGILGLLQARAPTARVGQPIASSTRLTGFELCMT